MLPVQESGILGDPMVLISPFRGADFKFPGVLEECKVVMQNMAQRISSLLLFFIWVMKRMNVKREAGALEAFHTY